MQSAGLPVTAKLTGAKQLAVMNRRMHRRAMTGGAEMTVLRMGFLLGMIALGFHAVAEPVFVAGAEDGQGFLRQRDGVCYLVTPQHVLGGAREASLTGNLALSHEAVLQRSYDPDLAILRVAGRIECPGRFPDGGALEALLSQTGEGRLVSRSASGALFHTPVEIIAADERFLRVRARAGETLFRGLSGSPMMIGGSTAGMLQSVDADSGIGTVLRQDYMNRLLGSWFPEVRSQSRPVIRREVEPVVPTNDPDGLILRPGAEAPRSRPALSGDVMPARPLPVPEEETKDP